MTASAGGRARWRSWLPALAVMALIFVLSSQSGLRFSEDVAVERPIRATGHLLAYGTLAALLLVALARGQRPRTRDVVLAVAIAVIYGATDELHQSFVPDRSGRVEDLVVDAIGALLGAAAAWVALGLRAGALGRAGRGDR